MPSGIPKNIKSLAQYRPDIACQWDYDKNRKEYGESFNPYTVSYSSHKYAWWMCENNHSYKSTINHRTSINYPRACPYCANRKIIIGENDLKTKRPEIAEQWDYELNIDANGNKLLPEQFTEHSGYSAHWKCKFGHTWKAKIASRTTDNTGCPYCIGANTSFAEQFIYFYLLKAGLTVKNRVKINSLEYDIAIKELNTLIEYNSVWHKGKDEYDRKKLDNCNSLGIRFVRIIEDNNIGIRENTYYFKGIAHGKIYELVDIIEDIIKDTEYANKVTDKDIPDIKASAFKFSRKIKINKEESLGYRFPELINIFDTKLNKDINPYDVSAYSSYEAYWNINGEIYLRKIKDVVGNYIKKKNRKGE